MIKRLFVSVENSDNFYARRVHIIHIVRISMSSNFLEFKKIIGLLSYFILTFFFKMLGLIYNTIIFN